MTVSVMIWQLVECTMNRQLCDYVIQKYFFCRLYTQKSVTFDVITEWNVHDRASFHPSLPCLFAPSHQLPSNLVKNNFSFSYTKTVELRTIGYDTQPVGTVIQKSLKVPEWQISVLHSQAGSQKRWICSKYHQWRHM
jgi:hypothetical protein